ncbi:MAG TPA: SBBP repeat-containing protein [Terriglobales bacterium]|nr:SBBP repeat-containing protein [Terriglobales bacterium]
MSRGRLIRHLYLISLVFLKLALSAVGQNSTQELQRLLDNAKPNPHGLVVARYLGGSGTDNPYAIVTDAKGFVYVAGLTTSLDFPTTPGAYQTSHSCCGAAAFLVKLTPDGKELVFSTYLGNNQNEFMNADHIAIGTDGSVYLTGITKSSLPLTPGSYQQKCNSSIGCVYVAKLNASGSRLEYATYLSGSGSDRSFSLKVDSRGRAWVTGDTNSFDFPKTSDAFQSRIGGGYRDAFISVLSSDGNTLEYSTLLGGYGSEGVFFVRFLSDDAMVFTGGTDSPDFPVTENAFQKQFGGIYDGVYGALDLKHGLIYSTFLGDERSDTSGLTEVLGSYFTHGTSRPSRTAPAGATGPSTDFFVAGLPDLQGSSTAIITLALNGSYSMKLRGPVPSAALLLALVKNEPYPTPSRNYSVGWNRNRKAWSYAYSADLPIGYWVIANAFQAETQQLWTAVTLRPNAPPQDSALGSRMGDDDVLILREDFGERKFAWDSARTGGNELSLVQTVEVSRNLIADGTGTAADVEFSCVTTSAQVSCEVEPGSVRLEESQTVRLRVHYKPNQLLPALGIFGLPFFAFLRSGTKNKRLIAVASISTLSLVLVSCAVLPREAVTVELTARSNQQTASTSLNLTLPRQ